MNTKKLKQLVLDLAIHGKLVPQDPNDEPASELLKRIQADVETHGRASNKSKGKKSAISSVNLDEVPFEVPEGWCWCRLGIIARLINGDRSSNYPNKSEYVAKGMPWINTGHITPDGILSVESMNFITPEKYDSLGSGKIRENDLVFCLRGATFGKIAKVEPYKEGAIASSLVIIRCCLSSVRNYIFHVLKSDYAKAQLALYDNGSAQPNLAAKDVEKYFIPLPPLAEQHRIVAAIEKWFAVIDQLEKNEADLKKSIEQTKKKVLDLAIRGKLVESEGEWEEKRLGDVAEYINGRAFKPEEWEISGMPIIRIQNLNDESAKYNYTSQRFEDKYIVNRGDLLFAWAASLGTYIWKGEDAWLNQHIFKVVPRDFISKRFLHIVLDALISDFYTQSHGSGMVHITRKSFENIKIPVPSLAEQKRIVEKVEEVIGVLERIEGMM